MIFRKTFGFKGGALLLLSLALVAGLGSWEAEPAEAIIGGRDADILGGQVQVISNFGAARPEDCSNTSGTLISPGWVLTAKHCVERFGVELEAVEVLVGDKRRLQGQLIGVNEVYKNPTTDTALLELEEEAPEEHVVGYSAQVPEIGSLVQIRGWGRTNVAGLGVPATYPETLQEATKVVSSHSSSNMTPTARARLESLLTEANEGTTAQGDSGAGWYAEGLIRAVHSQGGGATWSVAVPTADIAPWIEETSGVAPADEEYDTAEEDEYDTAEEGEEEPTEEVPPTEEGCAGSPTLPAEDTSPEGTRDIDGHGRGQSGADAGNAIANTIEDVQNADENVEALVGMLAQANPACNVMVIQQETYDGPQGITGVKGEGSTVVFGTNTFDVWVFDSGTFTNTGDMGYDNWGWSGTWTRSEDLRTVTFTPRG